MRRTEDQEMTENTSMSIKEKDLRVLCCEISLFSADCRVIPLDKSIYLGIQRHCWMQFRCFGFDALLGYASLGCCLCKREAAVIREQLSTNNRIEEKQG